MKDHSTYETPIKFRPDYEWPASDAEADCPRCGSPMMVNENRPEYMGKPWWCGDCRWQFTNDEIS